MLELEFKKISEDTMNVMENSVSSNHDFYGDAVSIVESLLGDGDIHLLNSANSCLITLAECVHEPILVQDMGGWNGFIKSCELFNKKVMKIETDYALINIKILDKYLKENTVNTLYITSPASYTARQPIKEIYELCNIHEVILIVDISGSIGDKTQTEHADIQVASTGTPKIINIENGGIINNKTQKIKLNKHLLKSLKADKITCAGIANEIPKATKIEYQTRKQNQYLKEKLEKKLEKDSIHNIIHPEHEGINTIITVESKSKAKKLAYNINQRIKTERKIITTGPNYNRIKKASINIETKNIDPDSLTKENLDKLAEIVVEEIKHINP